MAVLAYIAHFLEVVLGLAAGWLVFRLPEMVSDLRSVFRSVIFQGALAFLALYATSSNRSLFVSVFLLTALAVSGYLQYGDYRLGKIREWFWVSKAPVSRSGLVIYFFVIGFLFLYSLLNVLA